MNDARNARLEAEYQQFISGHAGDFVPYTLEAALRWGKLIGPTGRIISGVAKSKRSRVALNSFRKVKPEKAFLETAEKATRATPETIQALENLGFTVEKCSKLGRFEMQVFPKQGIIKYGSDPLEAFFQEEFVHSMQGIAGKISSPLTRMQRLALEKQAKAIVMRNPLMTYYDRSILAQSWARYIRSTFTPTK